MSEVRSEEWREILDAANEWEDLARDARSGVAWFVARCRDAGGVERIVPRLGALTSELIEWCDERTNIDPSPLHELYGTIFAFAYSSETVSGSLSPDLDSIMIRCEGVLARLRSQARRKPRRPTPVSADLRAGKIVVDGEEHEAGAHHCQIVKALLDAGGLNVTGPTMNELPGCRNKKIPREIANLERRIPALKRYLLPQQNSWVRFGSGRAPRL